MAGRDGTRPLGTGPRTGWGMGWCTGYARVPRRRFFGRAGWVGGGRGWRHWYYATACPGGRAQGFAGQTVPPPWWGAPCAPPSSEQEIEMLKEEAEWLKEQLEAINRRIDELTQEASK